MSCIDRLLGRTPPAEPAPVTIHLDMRALAGGRLSRDSESTLLGAYGTVLDVPESPESDWRRLNLDANTLDNAPRYTREDQPDYSDDYGRRVYEHYGVTW